MRTFHRFRLPRVVRPAVTGLLLLAVGWRTPAPGFAEEPLPDLSAWNEQINAWKDELLKRTDVKMKTLGGRQFWGDVQFYHDWRIQQNVFTKHYRLLDGDDYRHASGTLEDCQRALEQIRQERKLEPMSGKAVVLVHGITDDSKVFRAMKTRLQKEGYLVFGFDYPSTQVTIPECADYLRQSIESLEDVDEINLVVHSMGGLLTRELLKSYENPRLKRIVMMGVPNLGANMADRFQQLALYKLILGPAGQQLVTDPNGYISQLPIPKHEFGIIAGFRDNANGYNPLITGDDDGTVSVKSTRLPGAADFAAVKVLHRYIMRNDEAIDITVNFLATGRFRKDGAPQPISREEPQDSSKPTASAK